MTIQRQYSLPNCTLILEGMSEGSSNEARPLMSILANAECHFVGHKQPLIGGRDFFESLVAAVSQYAQEFLSGVRPVAIKKSNLIELHKAGEGIHRLSYSSPEDGQRNGAPPQTELNLNTVQLFDLVEAIDQFLADSQTLPDLSLNLAPVSRRYVRASEPVAKRAIPAFLGASSLAAAAAIFFLIPSPKVQEPKDLTPQQAASSQTASPSPTGGSSPNPNAASPSPAATASPSASPSPNVADTEAAIVSAPAITDTAQIAELEKDLYARINQAWQTEPTFKEDLVYRVSVASNGDILGYKYINDAALEFKDETPLPDLYFKPVADSPPRKEPIAQYRVVFTPGGELQVSPWQQEAANSPTNTANSATEITNAEQLEQLQTKLYDQVDQNWQEKPTFEQDLVFRVRVKQDGTIADYTPDNQTATDFAQETPLPDLGKPAPEDAAPSEPVALFKVVFKPNGVLQVSPWRGFRE
jgi:hypothetical protein